MLYPSLTVHSVWAQMLYSGMGMKGSMPPTTPRRRTVLAGTPGAPRRRTARSGAGPLLTQLARLQG